MKLIKIKFAALSAGLLLAGASVPPLVHALDAQTPSAAQATVTQTIVLQHIVPVDLLKSLHWDQTANLPAGVTKIQALPAQNALAVTATPAGFAKVGEIVKQLDIEPRQVKIVSAFAYASDADLKASGIKFDQVPVNEPSQKMYRFYATGSRVAQFLQTLTKQRAVTEEDITTTNNVTATISRSDAAPSRKARVQQFTVTPHINGDDTITLGLHWGFSDGTVNRGISTTRTVRNGDTMVIVIPPAASQAAGENTLFFVTPTVK